MTIDYDKAEELLQKADGSVKLAIAMYKLGVGKETACGQLEKTGGFLWKLLDDRK